MSSELSKRFDALRAIAPRLDAVTDEATRIVTQVEQILTDDLHLGIPASVRLAAHRLGPDENDVQLERFEYLVFDRIGNKFRVALSIVVTEMEGDCEPQSREVIPWPSCSREQKLRAFPALPRLLDEILRTAEAMAVQAEKTAEAIKEMLKDEPPCPPTPPAPRRTGSGAAMMVGRL